MDKKQNEQKTSSFEKVLAKIPKTLQKEVLEMDAYLKTLRPLKFKRSVDKNGVKINYVAADFGISYGVNVSATDAFHQFGWYFINDRQTKTWYRKDDYMEKTLVEIAKTNPQQAERLFHALAACSSCHKDSSCSKISYSYAGQKRVTHYGRVYLSRHHDDFNDAREFFRHLNTLMERKLQGK
jgi:hypothetical protein